VLVRLSANRDGVGINPGAIHAARCGHHCCRRRGGLSLRSGRHRGPGHGSLAALTTPQQVLAEYPASNTLEVYVVPARPVGAVPNLNPLAIPSDREDLSPGTGL